MARPRIKPSARSVPISFSVKPDLAEKIDEYSHQIRFSRSKFLAQAVTEAITKIEMGYDLSDFDVRNMTDNQKLAIALNTLNEPTPEQQLNANIARILRDKLNEFLDDTPQKPVNTPSEPLSKTPTIRLIDIKRVEAGQYTVLDSANGEEVGHIYKDSNRKERPWVFSNHIDGTRTSSRTLDDAKDVAQEEMERV